GCIAQMRERLGAAPVPVAIPVGTGDEFDGIIDLIEMRWLRRDLVGKDVPETYRAEASLWRQPLIDAVCTFDDAVVAAVVEGRDVSSGLLRAALRHGTLSRRLTPVLCGSSHTAQGVPLLLDSVVDYLPSPEERGEVVGSCPANNLPVR